MGIVNLSQQSFYHPAPTYDHALRLAEKMILDGADILDVGAVATNPAVNVDNGLPSLQAELDQLIPFLELLSKNMDVTISVDTFRPQVMREAIAAGAHIINDQHALTESNALETAVELAVPVCLMHHFNPARLSGSTSNEVLLSCVLADLSAYVERCTSAGMKKENIILDPGFGGGSFGKNADENFYLLSQLDSIVALGFPVLVGLSRKSFLGELLNASVSDRLYGSVAAAMIAMQKGASIFRVHDVKATKDALTVLLKLCEYDGE